MVGVEDGPIAHTLFGLFYEGWLLKPLAVDGVLAVLVLVRHGLGCVHHVGWLLLLPA